MCVLHRTKDQDPKPDSSAEAPSKEPSPDTQASAPTNPAQEAQNVNPEEHLEPPERPQAPEGEIEVQQAEPNEFAYVVPGEPVAEAEVAGIEPSGSKAAALPRFNDTFKSAFQQVKTASAEIEAGISEVVARQIEAAEAAAASEKQADVEVSRPNDAFVRSKMQVVESLSAQIQAGLREFEELGEGRRAAQQVEIIIKDSSDNAPHDASPSATTEEVLGEVQSRGQEALEAASVASQSQAPEAVTEQDVPSAATAEDQSVVSDSAAAAETPAALPDEIVKAAEEVRETEEVGGGETETPEPVVLTATEAQEVVNEKIATSALDKKTSPQEPASHSDAPAAAATKKARKSKRDSLTAAAEKELGDKAEEKAAQLITEEDDVPDEPSRLPRNVQAFYLQPLRRQAKYNVPSCNLQLRSYSIRPLESFCDFALRAAYYLGLPAYGPTPLPKIIQRWTVPKSSFIFKKSQENFERITRRRLIQIRDGHPETVQIWLAFLQKHQQAGVGMKANVWEFSSLGKSLSPLHELWPVVVY